MTLFTPIVNFDFESSKIWVKISKIKIKKISDKELLNYFGIAERTLDENNNLSGCSFSSNFPLMGPTPINEMLLYKIFACKYAFVSDLEYRDHQNEVKKSINAFRLLRLNNVTCPITIQRERPMHYFTYPLESNIKKKCLVKRICGKRRVAHTDNLLNQ